VTFNLVKAHDGEIGFEPRPGGGTKFMVRLPTIDRRRQKRIMVVDDDHKFCALLIRALTLKTRCRVEGFANGAEALIRLGSNPPDVLILDMFMPHMDGLGVCRAIKNELGVKTTKVVIVTGFPQHPNVIAAQRLGFEQIVVKPMDMDNFIGIVRRNLDDKLA
jgi:DNA-binding NtrC family response regulator